LLNCDLAEVEKPTLIKYLAQSDEKLANVVKLNPYTTQDQLCSLAYKV